ncbi:PTS glucose transporter subunit IIA, partial [Lacticaseibacillus paracasei]|jgi:phosphotransferase system IIA component
MEILVHLGIDTVNLKGAPFTVAVKAGQHVNKGDLLGTFDQAAIKKAGLDATTIVLITNSKSYARIEPVAADTTVQAGADLLAVQREDVKVESVEPA